MTDPSIALEVCVDSVASAITAEKAGAQRVELCANLVEGGTTPSAGMIRLCRERISIGLHLLIRPRRGDFLYSDLEFEVMRQEIEVARQLGADGVVLGILHPDGQIDVQRTRRLIDEANPLSVTFHRAFDFTPDPFTALAELKELGVDRVLTSGQKPTALEGAPLLQELIQRAKNEIVILPGGGITEQNVQEVVRKTGAKEIHASARHLIESDMQFRRQNLPMGGTPLCSEYQYLAASGTRIKAMLAAANGVIEHQKPKPPSSPFF
ncbi:MAG: copper homeostasis protein CutC [Rufibacter sp.]